MSDHPSVPRRGPSRRTVAKAAVLGVAGVLAGAGRASAADITVTQLGPRTYDLGIPSAALSRTAPVRIILPTSYAAYPGRTWPVLHLLHGAHDDYNSWTRETDIEAFTANRDLIVAMPDGGPTGIPTRWRTGLDYETFQLQEVPAVLRTGYRASTVQAVAGVSTGGYGAMAHAARHPGTFVAAASYSGIPDTTVTNMPTIIQGIVRRENLDPLTLWGDPTTDAATWQDFNPRVRAAALRGTALYVSVGSGSLDGGVGSILALLQIIVSGTANVLPGVLESLVAPSTQAFVTALGQLGIPATQHLYQGGGHQWSDWKREFATSWPVLAGALGLPT
ncbi:alpha/beta hydrolase family protein [Streptomyces sp. W16]|uniref:alpha/beta hydrolase n=1 Tax=Streptomyces sp. W16 TaxID=3076631 RepID=UPI00295B733D|nr:alpha/beta hydrolase family protein [Streptomyces sp. W16]MDV9177734.1 alpha/beta hydrolase family protein [Streptomyces sp. W16]